MAITIQYQKFKKPKYCRNHKIKISLKLREKLSKMKSSLHLFFVMWHPQSQIVKMKSWARKCFLRSNCYTEWTIQKKKNKFGNKFHSFIWIWKEGNWVLKFQCGNFIEFESSKVTNCMFHIEFDNIIIRQFLMFHWVLTICMFHWVWKLESSGKADSKASSTQLNSPNFRPSYLFL